jgi:flagellin
MFSVNTNAGAFAALQNLNATGRSLEVTQSRVNTGLKVASAKDNAAIYSIAQNMRGDVAGYRAVNNSLSRAQSELDVAIAGAEAISDLLIEMKEKAVAAKDSGLDSASRAALNNDFQQLAAQVTTISENATFNGKNLLTGDSLSAITDSTGTSSGTITASSSTLTLSSLSLDTADISSASAGGANTPVSAGSGNPWSSGDNLAALNAYMQDNFSAIYSGGNYDNSTGNFTSVGDAGTVGVQIQTDFGVSLGILSSGGNFLHLVSGSLYTEGSGASATFSSSPTSSSGGASAAVDAVEAAISTVNDVLSNLGATSNRLAIQQEFAGKLSDSLEVGIGNLVDADLARESANLQAFQTKQQLGLQALGIANQAPQSVLSLFR